MIMGAKNIVALLGLGALGFSAYGLSLHVVPIVMHTYRMAQAPSVTVRTKPTDWPPLPISSSPSGSGTALPTQVSTVQTTASSYNWAGVVQSGTHETSVQASWKAPTFAQLASNPNDSVAEWIGLGGMQSGQLIQIGTITTPNSQGQATTTVFWEDLPSSARESASVPEGTRVTAKIEPDGRDTWRLRLTAQGYAGPLIDKVVTLTQRQASRVETSADWITEAPTTRSGVAPLAPVSGTKMTQVKANNIPLAKMSPGSLQTVSLYSQNGQLLAQPARLRGTNAITVNTVYGNLPSSPESSPGTIVTNPGYSTIPGSRYGPGSGYTGGYGSGYGYGNGYGGTYGYGSGYGDGWSYSYSFRWTHESSPDSPWGTNRY